MHAASGSPVAEEALRRIAALYVIEQQGAGLDPSQRLALRQKLALPVLANCMPGCWRRSVSSRREWHGQGRRRCPQALAGAGTLCQFGHAADRQQPGRKRHPPDFHRQKTDCSPVRSGPAAAPPQFRDRSPPPSLTALTRHAGLRMYWNVARRAPTARSTRCCHSRTLPNTEDIVQVGGPAAYGPVVASRPYCSHCRQKLPPQASATGRNRSGYLAMATARYHCLRLCR